MSVDTVTKRRAVAAIEAALLAEAEHRNDHDDWVERERLAVASEANRWAVANEGWQTVTVQDVERVEGRAMGHIDYPSKLALYVAELTWDLGEGTTDGE